MDRLIFLDLEHIKKCFSQTILHSVLILIEMILLVLLLFGASIVRGKSTFAFQNALSKNIYQEIVYFTISNFFT